MRLFQQTARVWLAILVSLLGACGFQLQGATEVPPEMAKTYLDATDTYTEFYRDLAFALKQRGIELTSSASEADTVLRIRRDETGQRVLSVSAQNVPREYEVFYTVSYTLSIDGEIRSGADELTMTRDYTWDETQVLGKAREEAILRSALVDSLVRAVLTRLAYSE